MSNVIDINVFETTEEVTINVTHEVVEVNINKATPSDVYQSDWNETDPDSFAFIKNKPSLLKWIDYATGFTQIPTELSEGLYEYVYSFGTKYRKIDESGDAFYNDLECTDLLIKKDI